MHPSRRTCKDSFESREYRFKEGIRIDRPKEPQLAAEGSLIAAFREKLLSGDTTCVERTREELDNIELYSGRFNAFITTFAGENGLALSRARVLDGRLAKGDRDTLSPLFGVLLTVKDNTFLGGFPTTDGSEAFSDFVPQKNSEVVDQLLEAGCIPLGKTNLHELALGVTGTSGYGGPIHNPVDPSRVSGGSSGGAAVSVALSKGGDPGRGERHGRLRQSTRRVLRSLRVQAVAWGAQHGRGFPSQWHAGPPRSPPRSVPDVALGFRAITGSSPVPKRRQKLGVPTNYFVDDMDSHVSRDFWRAIDLLKESGEFEVQDIPVEEDYRRFTRGRAIITLKEAAWFYESLLQSLETRKKMHADVLTLMDRGTKIGMIQYMNSINLRLELIHSMSRLLRGIDAMLMPTCLVVAPKIEAVVGKEAGQLRSLILRNTELFNLSGMPAVSLPNQLWCGYTAYEPAAGGTGA